VARRPRLRELAERAGILPDYRPMGGAAPRATRDVTREALLGAMGLEASSEAAAGRALEALDAAERARLLDPVRVSGVGARGAERLPFRWAGAGVTRCDWRVVLREESGRRQVCEGRARIDARSGRGSLPLPAPLEPGIHRLGLEVEAAGESGRAEQRLVACPARCFGVDEALGRRRGFGLLANLFGLRSAASWGVGDLGDLGELAALAGRAGAAFVGLGPLHATRNRGVDVSPYAPVSRLYRNEIYLAVESVPELRDCSEARRRLADPGFARRLGVLRERGAVAYDEVRAAKREILVLLHRCFAERHRGAGSARGRAYARYCAGEEPALGDFAAFVALADRFADEGRPADWRRWPLRFRDPRSAAVRRFRDENSEEIDFQRWIQFELERQLAAAAARGREAGLEIGLYGDLAVGSAASGFDAWAAPGLFADGASVGAPPDDFSDEGQDWSFPPLVPLRLAEGGYEFFARVLRAAFAQVGALRIDHAMGLQRLWWVPAGRSPTEGAYVRYPVGDLLGILALESRRRGAIVVGEDLGTVPRGLAALLARWGVLSTRLLPFERRGGWFRPAHHYSRRALVASGSHDLPPLAGFVAGRDLELRRRVGQIPDAAALEAARAQRERVVAGLYRRLGVPRAEPGQGGAAHAPLAAALVAFLSRTPAALVAFTLDDLVGESEPANLPGVPQERHPSWSRRMQVAVQELPNHPAFGTALAAVARPRRRRGAV
jgi:4-alpha-glucanotransferase